LLFLSQQPPVQLVVCYKPSKGLCYCSPQRAVPQANNLKPYEYFEYLLTQIPAHMDDTDRSFLEDFLPWSPKLSEYIRKQKDRG